MVSESKKGLSLRISKDRNTKIVLRLHFYAHQV